MFKKPYEPRRYQSNISSISEKDENSERFSPPINRKPTQENRHANSIFSSNIIKHNIISPEDSFTKQDLLNSKTINKTGEFKVSIFPVSKDERNELLKELCKYGKLNNFSFDDDNTLVINFSDRSSVEKITERNKTNSYPMEFSFKQINEVSSSFEKPSYYKGGSSATIPYDKYNGVINTPCRNYWHKIIDTLLSW